MVRARRRSPSSCRLWRATGSKRAFIVAPRRNTLFRVKSFPGVANYGVVQFPLQKWYIEPHARSANSGLELLGPRGICAIHSLYRWLHSSSQDTFGNPCASACQRKPKLRQIRMAAVIFRFIDFTPFRDRLMARLLEELPPARQGESAT